MNNCTTCHIKKPESDFYKSKHEVLWTKCKQCYQGEIKRTRKAKEGMKYTDYLVQAGYPIEQAKAFQKRVRYV